MKIVKSLFMVFLFSCQEKEKSVSPTPYQIRVDNQTDLDIKQVTAQNQSVKFLELGPIPKRTTSAYAYVSGVHLTSCTDIELILSSQTLRRAKDYDCNVISFAAVPTGNYVLRIKSPTATGFEAVVEKE
jgi:hypothetical protein